MKCRTALIYSSIAFMISLLPKTATADAEKLPSQTILQWDNDLLAGTDRNYTNGARIAFFRELNSNSKTHNLLQRGLQKLSGTDNETLFGDRRFQRNDVSQLFWGVGLTQLMFTPEDPNTLTAPTGERPYAGWLGAEFTLYANNTKSANSVTLSLGTTGKNSFAEKAQKWIHTNVSDSPIFQGWDSQVPGELTMNLHFDRKQRIHFFDQTADWLIEFDGYYEWGAAIGNFKTDAYIGSLIRLGYNLPPSYITPRVQLGSSGHNLFGRTNNKDSQFSILGFGGIRGYGVLHDITLDGPVFRNFNTGVNSEPWVGEVILGLSFHYNGLEASVSHTIRTDAFTNQDKNSQFGSVILRATMPF